jgi:hypothetical protein
MAGRAHDRVSSTGGVREQNDDLVGRGPWAGRMRAEDPVPAVVRELPVWVVAALFVVVVPGLVMALQLVIRRRWPELVEGDHNDVAGFLISVVGVIYAVLLAFVVIVSWQKFASAESVAGQEASVLRALTRDAAVFAEPTRSEMRALVREYAVTVRDREWPLMADGRTTSPQVVDVLDRMAATIARAQPAGPAGPAFIEADVRNVDALVSLRSQRLDFVDQGLPGVLWTALWIGGALTVGFGMIFGVRRTGLHLIMVGSLVALVGILLFVIAVIDFPFQGGVAVQPTALQRVLTDLYPSG